MYLVPGAAHSSQGRAYTVGGNNNAVPLPGLPGNGNQTPTRDQDQLFTRAGRLGRKGHGAGRDRDHVARQPAQLSRVRLSPQDDVERRAGERDGELRVSIGGDHAGNPKSCSAPTDRKGSSGRAGMAGPRIRGPNMKITAVETTVVSLPCETGGPPPLFAGKPWTHLDILVVRVETDGGLVGWGEAFGHAAIPSTKAALELDCCPAGSRSRSP